MKFIIKNPPLKGTNYPTLLQSKIAFPETTQIAPENRPGPKKKLIFQPSNF